MADTQGGFNLKLYLNEMFAFDQNNSSETFNMIKE